MLESYSYQKTEKPVVLVDMDDTLAEFAQVYWDVHDHVFNERIPYETVSDWYFNNVSSRGMDAYKLLQYPGLFKDLPVKPYAKEFINQVQQFSDVFIVSDSPEGTSHKEQIILSEIHGKSEAPFSNPTDDKRSWLKQHFPTIPQSNVIFCGCKWMVHGDILVDDKPDTYVKFNERGRDIILIDMPYNRHINTKWRARDLRHAEEMIFDILKKKGKIAS